MAAKPIIGNGLQDELEFLLSEVGVLANRLKTVVRTVHVQNKLPTGGKDILQTLARSGSQTVPQLARDRSSSRQNLQVLVNRLETAGWVEFVDNLAHKRSDLVRLTDKGRNLLIAALEREAIFLGNLLKHTTEAEVLSAGKLLSRLRQLLGGSQTIPLATSFKTKSAKVRSRRRIPSMATKQPSTQPATPAQPEPLEEEYPINLL